MVQEYYATHFLFPAPIQFVSILSRPAGYRSSFCHIENHMNIITSGRVTLKHDGTVWNLSAGNAVVLPKGLFYEIESAQGYAQIGLEFDSSRTDPRGSDALLKHAFAGGICAIAPGVLHETYCALRRLMFDEGNLTHLRIISLSEGVLWECLRCFDQKASSFSVRLSKVLNECDPCTLNVAALADKLHYSKTHTERMMKAHFGCTAAEYLGAIRLHAVVALLRETDCTIAEIAENTGFYDAAHLICFFKRHFGVTPGTFRNNRSELIAVNPVIQGP